MSLFVRNSSNPLISPEDLKPSRPDYEILGTFNPGAARCGGDTILLIRVSERPVQEEEGVILCPHLSEDGELTVSGVRRDDPAWDTRDPRKIWNRENGGALLTSISHLRLARSRDGAIFRVEDSPWLAPESPYESFGVEDPRITPVDGRYYINYTAVSPCGIATALVSTEDFRQITRYGIIFPPANRDVVIFPEQVGGRYVCYHRPMPWGFGGMHMWGATSPDLLQWGNHRLLIQTQPSGWESGRIGGGAPPIRTEKGWLSFYHAADKTNRYCMGAFLTPLNEPFRVIARSPHPVLEPEEAYETEGFFGNVVFSCGAVLGDDAVHLYYGAADQRIALAEARVEDVLDSLVDLPL